MKTEWINLTSRLVWVGYTDVPPSGMVATVENLPEPRDGTEFFVDEDVRKRFPDRMDLVGFSIVG